MKSCNEQKCEEECKDGKVWVDNCDLPHCPLTCSDLANPNACVEPENCEPACRCKNGTVMNDVGQCVEPSKCSCTVDGKEYLPGDIIDTGNDCETW